MAIQMHQRVKVTKAGDPLYGFIGSVVALRPGVDCQIQVDDGRSREQGGELPPGTPKTYSLVSGSEEVAPT